MNKSKDFINFLNQEEIDIFLVDNPVDKTIKKDPIKAEVVKIEVPEKEVIEKPKEVDLSKINDLDSLKQEIINFNHSLKETSLSMVFSRGNAKKPKVMFIGEAPGQEEDIKGIPFVGKGGDLLDKMISAIKLSPEDFYITNIVNYRPKNNIVNQDEIKDFMPFLKKHIELVQPQTICLLGSVTLKSLFPEDENISKKRGEWLELNGIKTIATFHPSYLLKFPIKKADAWEDLQKLI